MYMIRPASRPITALHVRVSRAAPRPCLLVLLPGLFDTPDAFFESGFVDDARRASGRCDLLAVDSSLAYYTDGSIVDVLTGDVLWLARARRYEEIWVVGISMGALGAVLLAEHNPGSVRGLVLIAPWVGEDDLVGPVARAGGLRAWRAPPIDRRRRDLRQANYIALSWLRAHPERASGPEIYLGVGEQDRRRATTELIAEVIEPERVRRVPGGHDWRTWRAVWQSILRSPPWEPGSGAGR